MTIQAGDTVTVNKQIYFLPASHPETGDEIEVVLPRMHHLTVKSVNSGGVTVSLPNGYESELGFDDIS